MSFKVGQIVMNFSTPCEVLANDDGERGILLNILWINQKFYANPKYTRKANKYETVQYSNGFYGVIDTESKGCKIISAGMTKDRAIETMNELNERNVR